MHQYFDKVPISAIILTFNEEVNIRDCLNCALKLTDDIIVIDSGSTDNTLTILKQYPVKIYFNKFENYSKQRNWAFENVEIKNDWILNLDADHRLTEEFIREVKYHFKKGIDNDINGFMASRRTLFLNKWIKHGGHYPVYHGIIFRKGYGFCEHKEYDQHFIIEGKSIVLKGDIVDIITDSLTTFISRHNKWASLEANDVLMLHKKNDTKLLKALRNGNPMEQRRYLRLKYYSYPLFWRSFFYFIYRYFFKMGFKDGKEGLIFHALQGFWFRFLVDSKIYEKRLQQNG